MRLGIKRIDTDLPMPEYQTAGSVAFDLYARIETVIQPEEVARIPANLIIKLPPGYCLLVASRSSAPKKKGLLIPHGVGILDQDFHGPNDEVQAQVYNFTGQAVTVARGERIAQALVVPVAKCELTEMGTEMVAAQDRGGFGSTG